MNWDNSGLSAQMWSPVGPLLSPNPERRLGR